jgi:hypothetical protein
MPAELGLTDALPRAWGLRVPPNPSESWLGYLTRLAAYYRCSPWHLLVPIAPTGIRTTHLNTGRALGMLATEQTLAKVGHLFSLTPQEANDLFLMRYSAWLNITDAERALQDPLSPRRTRKFARARRRGVRGNSARFRCQECQREDPTRWDLTWLLELHRVCVDHHITLTDRSISHDEQPQPAEAVCVEAQQRVLAALAAPTEMRDTLEAWANSLAEHNPPSPSAFVRIITEPPKLRPGKTLPTKIRESPALLRRTIRAGFTPDHPLVIESCSSPHPNLGALLLRYDAPRTVSSHRLRPSQLAHYPRMVPAEVYSPGLSDLSYPLDYWAGRRIARIAIQMYETGGTCAQACEQCDQRLQRHTARLQARLEAEGRLDLYWQEVAQAAAKMRNDPTDYAARRDLVEDGTAKRAAKAAVSTHLAVGIWAMDRWASHMPKTGFVRASQEKLDAVEDTYGTYLRAILSGVEQAKTA